MAFSTLSRSAGARAAQRFDSKSAFAVSLSPNRASAETLADCICASVPDNNPSSSSPAVWKLVPPSRSMASNRSGPSSRAVRLAASMVFASSEPG